MSIEPRTGRERPRKDKSGETSKKRGRSHWSEDDHAFFSVGRAWVTGFMEIEPIDNGGRWGAILSFCLGKEDDIAPTLEGNKAIPEEMHPRRRAVLELRLEESRNGGAKACTGATGPQRGSHTRAVGHGQNCEVVSIAWN